MTLFVGEFYKYNPFNYDPVTSASTFIRDQGEIRAGGEVYMTLMKVTSDSEEVILDLPLTAEGQRPDFPLIFIVLGALFTYGCHRNNTEL